ncbi:hypothetical protein N9I83_01545 [bacterium]|nr:hypothetical protein [bacterium]
MEDKPQIHVDAVLLIDIWGAESFVSIISDGTDNIGGFTPNDWLNYQTTYQQRCHSFLQKFKFDTLINATYRGPTPTFSSEKFNRNEDQDAEFSPMHYKHYNCNPRKIMNANCQMADICQLVKPGGTIIVGGGSWGACVHFRPVGIHRLMNYGFRVFTAPELCYQTPVHSITGARNSGIHHQDLLIDDIVWSRSVINGHYYDFLYEGVMVHQDNALERVDHYGVPHKDRAG